MISYFQGNFGGGFDMIKFGGPKRQSSNHIKQNLYSFSTTIQIEQMKKQIEILFIQVHHRCKQFDDPPCVIQDNKIHIYTPIFFMLVHLINEWQPNLKPMIHYVVQIMMNKAILLVHSYSSTKSLQL